MTDTQLSGSGIPAWHGAVFQILKGSAPSTEECRANEWVGSGFFVTDTLAVTCAHVLRDAGYIPGTDSTLVSGVMFEPGQWRDQTNPTPRQQFPLTFRVEPQYWSDVWQADIAILRLQSRAPIRIVPIPLGSSYGSIRKQFEVFGFPVGKAQAIGEACPVKVLDENEQTGYPVLQLQGSRIRPGYSGAPVVDPSSGAVIAIVRSGHSLISHGIHVPIQVSETGVSFARPIELARRLCAEIGANPDSPYRELASFDTVDRNLYFGRENTVALFLDTLATAPVVTLIGVSGCGKSSFVRAGIEKGLEQSRWPNLTRLLRPPALIPSATPLKDLLHVLFTLPMFENDATNSLPEFEGSKLDDLEPRVAAGEPVLAAQHLGLIMRKRTRSQGLLLVIDQFERLFQDCSSPAVIRYYMDFLATLITPDVPGKIKLILAMRLDALGVALKPESDLVPLLHKTQFRLSSMERAGLESAIKEPAEARFAPVDPRLIDALVSDVLGKPGDLPWLQLALSRLWDEAPMGMGLQYQGYSRLRYARKGIVIEGVQGAIANRAVEVWDHLGQVGLEGIGTPAQAQQAGEHLLLKLYVPAKSEHDTLEPVSRRVSRSELDSDMAIVAEYLVEERLLVSSSRRRDAQANARLAPSGSALAEHEKTYQVVHEALLRGWPTLTQETLKEHAEFQAWNDSELEVALRDFETNGGASSFLLQGPALAKAEQYLVIYGSLLVGPKREFIVRSINARNRRKRIDQLLVIAGLALIAGVIVVFNIAQARAEARRFATASALLAASEVDAHNFMSAELAAAGALNVLDIPNYRQALLDARLSAPHPLWAASSDPCAAISADGKVFATIRQESDGHSRLVLVSSDPTITLVQPGTEDTKITKAVFAPLGYTLAYGTKGGVVQVWDPSSGSPRLAPTSQPTFQPGLEVSAINFNPTGNAVVFGLISPPESNDNPLWLWDLSNDELSLVVNRKSVAWGVSVDNDGRIAAGGNDSALTIYTLLDDKWIGGSSSGADDVVMNVAFSPNHELIAFTSSDGRTYICNAHTGDLLRFLQGHTGDVIDLSWSEDSAVLATSGGDGTARLWNVSSGVNLLTIGGQDGSIRRIRFSGDQLWLATGASKGGLHRYSLDAAPYCIQLGSSNSISTAAAFQPKTSQVFVASQAFDPSGKYKQEATLTRYDLATRHPILPLFSFKQESVSTMAFDQSGKILTTAGEEPAIVLWNTDTATGQPLTLLDRQSRAISSQQGMDWSAVGTLIVGGSNKGFCLIPLEQLSTDSLTFRPQKFPLGSMANKNYQSVFTVAHLPDGSFLVGGGSGLLSRWNSDGVQVWELSEAHANGIWGMAVSPTAQWVATGSADRSVKLFPLDGSLAYGALQGIEGSVNDVAASPDGRWLAVAGMDAQVYIFHADRSPEEIVKALPAFLLRNFERPVWTIEFSSDSKYLVAAGLDGPVRVYDMNAVSQVFSTDAATLVRDTAERQGADPRMTKILDAFTTGFW